MTEGSVPQYKLILLKTVPGKCDSDDNLKIIGFTMPESFGSVFSNDETVTKENVAQAITKASSEDMKLDDKITRATLIGENCLSIHSSIQKEPATPLSSVASEPPTNNETVDEKTGDEQKDETTGGSKKQSKRNRKNRRNRRSQKK